MCVCARARARARVCVCVCVCVCSALLYDFFFGRTLLLMCIEYHMWVNMYHVSAQGVDERMINVHYYYKDKNIWRKKNHLLLRISAVIGRY